jgi:hypothetical protein
MTPSPQQGIVVIPGVARVIKGDGHHDRKAEQILGLSVYGKMNQLHWSCVRLTIHFRTLLGCRGGFAGPAGRGTEQRPHYYPIGQTPPPVGVRM